MKHLVAIAIVLTVAAPAHAQTQIVSINPFTSMAGWYIGEYEHTMTPNATWGVSAASTSFSSAGYKNVNAMLRYYPRTPFSGFFLGGQSGVYHVSARRSSGDFYGAGFELGYTWLLGRREHVAISLGAGMNRLFGGALEGVSLTIPSLRLLNVGVAF